ncbi:MAG: pilus assembly protein [Planctomycetota bacterium]|nr:pilus assembly protein [Planctomycetota bacterium]
MDSARLIRRWRNQKPSRIARSGAAVVEFAVCLPVIMVIVLAAIEACSMIFLRQALQATAYEAVRCAVEPARTSQEILDCADGMLSERKVQQGTVQLDPSNPAEATAGSPVTVTVTAPLDSNRLMPPWFFGSRNVTAKCVMLKEAN